MSEVMVPGLGWSDFPEFRLGSNPRPLDFESIRSNHSGMGYQHAVLRGVTLKNEAIHMPQCCPQCCPHPPHPLPQHCSNTAPQYWPSTFACPNAAPQYCPSTASHTASALSQFAAPILPQCCPSVLASLLSQDCPSTGITTLVWQPRGRAGACVLVLIIKEINILIIKSTHPTPPHPFHSPPPPPTAPPGSLVCLLRFG